MLRPALVLVVCLMAAPIAVAGEFCRLTYGVKFPMFAKTTVAGKHANRLYAQLAKVTGTEPQWNFHKYLIDRTGQKVLSFGGRVKPEDRALLASIEELLGK